MNQSLSNSFHSLETQRKALLSLIANLSHEQLHAHREGKWSIAQILSHLIASETLSVRYLNKKILGIHDAPNTGIAEDLVMMVLIISQRLPLVKFKAPHVLADNTPVYQTAAAIEQAWDKTRFELKEVLARFQDDQLRRKIYKHPIAGMLNIKQTVRFFGEHIIHHTPQVKNLLRQK